MTVAAHGLESGIEGHAPDGVVDKIFMANNGFDKRRAKEAIAQGRADLVAFGKPFISNPDLVIRLYLDVPLSPLNRETLYGGAEQGYTDYPVLRTSHRTPATLTRKGPGGDGECLRPWYMFQMSHQVALARLCPPDRMRIVQEGFNKRSMATSHAQLA